MVTLREGRHLAHLVVVVFEVLNLVEEGGVETVELASELLVFVLQPANLILQPLHLHSARTQHQQPLTLASPTPTARTARVPFQR